MHPNGFPHQGYTPYSYGPKRPARPTRAYFLHLLISAFISVFVTEEGRHFIGSAFRWAEKKLFFEKDIPLTPVVTEANQGHGSCSGKKKTWRRKQAGFVVKKSPPVAPVQVDSMTIVAKVTLVLTRQKGQQPLPFESQPTMPKAQADTSFVKAVSLSAPVDHEAVVNSLEPTPADIH